MEENKVRPIEFRKGRAKLLAWPRKTPNGVRYNFSTRCLYPDRETGKLKEGQSFDFRDLANLAHAALEAKAWYRGELKAAYPDGTKNGEEPADESQPETEETEDDPSHEEAA